MKQPCCQKETKPQPKGNNTELNEEFAFLGVWTHALREKRCCSSLISLLSGSIIKKTGTSQEDLAGDPSQFV